MFAGAVVAIQGYWPRQQIGLQQANDFFALTRPALALNGNFVQEPYKAISLLVNVATPSPAIPGPPFDYRSFDMVTYKLTPWKGKHIALLTKSDTLDRIAMAEILSGLDAAYEYYSQLTARTPKPFHIYEGLSSIAQVPKTCGAGCGYLGATGIELLDATFETLYARVKSSGAFDQAVFYEFGRNFWFYGSQLEKVDPLVTGFAILNRFLSMDAALLKGAPFRPGMSYGDFERSILIDLLGEYFADVKWTWRTTLGAGIAPPNPNNWGAADLAAAMMNVVQRDAGSMGMQRFWGSMRDLPVANTQIEAMTNFLKAAKIATGKDYRNLLRDGSLPAP
jgi:serralysin